MAASRKRTGGAWPDSRGTSGGESYGPSWDYDSDMVRNSMQEQGARSEAKRSKGATRTYWTDRANKSHSDMQSSAEYGMGARRARAKGRGKGKKR